MAFIRRKKELVDYTLKNTTLNEMILSSTQLRLAFYEGYYQGENIVKGSVVLGELDSESTEICLYKRKKNKVKGQYFTINEFLEKYNKTDIMITSELYGDQCLRLEGILLDKKETPISLYFKYKQDLVYDIVTIVETHKKDITGPDRYLIKNTTKDERIKIVSESLGIDASCESGDSAIDMYDAYIDGVLELSEINRRYNEFMEKGNK